MAGFDLSYDTLTFDFTFLEIRIQVDFRRRLALVRGTNIENELGLGTRIQIPIRKTRGKSSKWLGTRARWRQLVFTGFLFLHFSGGFLSGHLVFHIQRWWLPHCTLGKMNDLFRIYFMW